jgi:hypothetical protein
MLMLYNLFPRVPIGGFVLVCNWDNGEVQRALQDFWAWHQMYPQQQTHGGDLMLWVKDVNPSLRTDKWRWRPTAQV